MRTLTIAEVEQTSGGQYFPPVTGHTCEELITAYWNAYAFGQEYCVNPQTQQQANYCIALGQWMQSVVAQYYAQGCE